MPPNLTQAQVVEFLTNDFRGLWSSVSSRSKVKGRGNFTFAVLAMTFLEFTCRLCKSDSQENAIRDFSTNLNSIDPRYFRVIPGLQAAAGDFALPYIETNHRDDTLVCALFDLIRNGLDHQYQQISAELTDGKHLGIRLSGPKKGWTLNRISNAKRKRALHLTVERDKNDNCWIIVSPARLFLDFRDAFERAGLLSRNLVWSPLCRPWRGKRYNFSSSDVFRLWTNVGSGTHIK